MVWFADGMCIAAGTRVTTPWGQLPVELLGVLDEVLAFDPENGGLTAARVVEIRQTRRECVCLQFACGGALRLTSDHPVWSPETRRYEAAGRWVTGELQLLSTLVDERPGVTVVTERAAYVGVLAVYDLVLAAPHHSFVAEQVVVHR
jgi:hypothetical protein